MSIVPRVLDGERDRKHSCYFNIDVIKIGRRFTDKLYMGGFRGGAEGAVAPLFQNVFVRPLPF